jgi:integrating conjugative element relaxase (TIGR03760 family)
MDRFSMLLSFFKGKRGPQSDGLPTQIPPIGLLVPESAATLLATPRRQQLIDHIWQRTSLSRTQFVSLYRAPLERYAELVQQFPASEAHHHSYLGGMLDHGLEIVAYALRLRQSHLLPVGAPPESQAAQADAWTAGTAYAALLHDVGKIAVDLHVEYEDGRPWHPWYGPLRQPYRFRFRHDREYRLHGAAAGLLYTDILDPQIMDWLSGFPNLWAALLYVLAGQYENAGVLGELVMQADQASVAQDVGGDPARARAAPKRTLQRQLIDGLRYLVRELKLNQSHASDGWLTQDALWLVSKIACDRLRAHLLSHGIHGIPEQNNSMFNLLQDHGIVLAAPGGKAIWRATVISQSGWTNTFTFLRVSPALIWESDERPPCFTGTVRVEEVASVTLETPTLHPSSERDEAAAQHLLPTDSRDAADSSVDELLDVMSSDGDSDAVISKDASTVPSLQHQHTQASSAQRTEAGDDEFIAWLRDGISQRRIIINDARALVHTVGGTVFLVSPRLFHRYAHEHPDICSAARSANMEGWEWAQKSFERLRLHKKQANGLNIWTCEVTGPRKSRRLHGYLLSDGRSVFSEIPIDNPYLKLIGIDSRHRGSAAA